jgi:ParB family chromosome partitioning protein
MSLKKRLEEKLGNLAVPVVSPSAAAPAAPAADTLARPAPKTAPGQMLAFRQHLQVHEVQVQDLQRQLDAYKGSQPARRIDPKQIRPSRWANRQEAHFRTPEFAAFKQELLAAGGNIQPIKVRPVADAPDTYEVVFGHRRHRACQELGIPVLALVEELSEQALFIQMERENRLRQDLSPWEQGLMYARALDEKLYASLGQLGEAIGRDKSVISRALKLARLPQVVIDAFPSPVELQYRWGEALAQALEQQGAAVLERARELAVRRGELPAPRVLEALMGGPAPAKADPLTETIEVDGQAVATLTLDPKGQVNLRFAAGALNTQQRALLVEAIQKICQPH